MKELNLKNIRSVKNKIKTGSHVSICLILLFLSLLAIQSNGLFQKTSTPPGGMDDTELGT